MKLKDRVAIVTGSGRGIGRSIALALAKEGANVTAEVLSVVQGPKLVIQKARRRKTYRRKTGHRQLYTRVKINKINVG